MNRDKQGYTDGDVERKMEQGVETVRTDNVLSESVPYEVVVYLADDGDAVAIDSDGIIAKDVDAGAVIQSAADDISPASTIFQRAGTYIWDSGVTFNQKGTVLQGEGLPWETSGGTAFGTVNKAGSNLTDTMLFFNEQFNGVRHVYFDADDTASYCINSDASSDARDYALTEFGAARATDANIRIASNHTFITGPSWIEFASNGGAGVEIANSRDIYIQGIFFSDNDGADIDLDLIGRIENLTIQENHHYGSNNAITWRGGRPVRDLKVSDNHYQGIGLNAGGPLNSSAVFAIEDNVDNVIVNSTIGGNTVNGEDLNNNVQTSHFIESLGSNPDLSGLTLNRNPHRNLSGIYIAPGGANGYTRVDANGTVVERASNRDIPSGSFTNAELNSVVTDTYFAYDDGGHIYTVPSPGLYRIEFLAEFNAAEDQTNTIARIDINKGDITYQAYQTTSGLAPSHPIILQTVELSKGDTIEFFVYQDSGSSLTMDKDSTQAIIRRIGE